MLATETTKYEMNLVMLMIQCVNCGKTLTRNAVSHHTSYVPEKRVDVCTSCHTRIHRNRTHPLYPNGRPLYPKAPQKDYSHAGPFTTLFMNHPKGRILDQVMLIGNGEFTIPTMTEGTDLTYRTVKLHLQHLQELGFVEPTRQLGNAQAYHFNLKQLHTLIQWGSQYQQERTNT